MSPSFFVNFVLHMEAYTIALPISAYICDVRIARRPEQICTDDANMMLKGLNVEQRILTRNDGDSNLMR